ncbi:hypothetical protein A1O1_02843 [Capronia coronata CBS 617.96]|uniref:Uncharacterized protein n=1 Tax=Capronia coronata CBS 617.96 TaxID=1182541 RepID=W9YNG6_9EURO|nr:uncharacterized protein A1O1_02843 [Capronia coronata CBS 617.96]EXJ94447.1 hypothetical protein A1O1_02843 [Capronia coronata CBS 617.96]
MRQEEIPPSHAIPTVPGPKPHVPTPPVVDPSGLFTVDPNPTPVDHLFRNQGAVGDKSKKTAKRKASDLEPQVQSRNGGFGNTQQVKKARLDYAKEEAPVEEDDSFVRGVEARSRAKEERKKTKMEKKRKRQSDGSTNSVSKGPKNKKQKQKHAQKLPGATTPADTQANMGKKRSKEDSTSNGAQNGQPAKKRKKSKSR